jgi:hypothetical protein
VRKELNVGDHVFHSLCENCSDPLSATQPQSTLATLIKVLKRIRVMLYTGNMDMVRVCVVCGVHYDVIVCVWFRSSMHHMCVL